MSVPDAPLRMASHRQLLLLALSRLVLLHLLDHERGEVRPLAENAKRAANDIAHAAAVLRSAVHLLPPQANREETRAGSRRAPHWITGLHVFSHKHSSLLVKRRTWGPRQTDDA